MLSTQLFIKSILVTNFHSTQKYYSKTAPHIAVVSCAVMVNKFVVDKWETKRSITVHVL